MTGDLYVISTPIGNLEDISVRAMRLILSTEIIACEDTRVTSNLVFLIKSKYSFMKIPLSAKKTYISLYDEIEESKSEEIISLLKEGKNVCFMTDSGTPLISDPGFKLIRKAINSGIRCIPVPGPSAFVAAASISGMPVNNILFIGFFPKKQNMKIESAEKIKVVKRLFSDKISIVFYETAQRLDGTLRLLKDILGDRDIIIAREITKKFESFTRTKISEELKNKHSLKGEITLVL